MRWIVVLPISLTVSITIGLLVKSAFNERTFSLEHIILSIVHPQGVMGFFWERAFAVFTFVGLCAWITPGRSRVPVVLSALLASVYAIPIQDASWPLATPFYVTAIVGIVFGCISGTIFGFWLRRRRKTHEESA